jgi:hypothetical protein
VKRFPHCVAKVFAPKDYLPIVLSGIVQSSEQAAVTTKLEVFWQFHLPYKMKGGDDASFAIATGPRVSVNTILGLPFMQASGMIIDLVDNIAECKHLSCPPFTIDFRCTSNHVPVMDEPSAYAKVLKVDQFNHVVKEIENLERYYEAKVQASGSTVNSTTATVSWGSKPKTNPPKIWGWGGDATTSSDKGSYLYYDQPDTPMANTSKVEANMSSRWVPPTSVNKDSNNQSSILKKDGYM